MAPRERSAERATTTAPARLGSSSPVWFDDIPEKLSKAVEEYDLPSTSDWQPLDELSNQTAFEGIDVSGESSVIEGSALVAPGTVYVTLNYGKREDATSFSDTYPARVFYRIEGKDIIVERIDVDTESFYR